MANKVLTSPATLEGVALRKDGSCTLRFSTQELAEQDLLIVKRFYGQFGNLMFSPSDLQPKDIPVHDPEFEGKTPSQRLRNVIFVLWRQMKDKQKTSLKFDDFYAGQLENIISQYKEKLEPLA